MTREQILALPADQLPRVLVDHGLAPADARIQPTAYDYLRALHQSPDLWRPHERFDHCMPLLRRLHAVGWITDIDYVPSRPPGKRGYIDAIRDLTHHGLYYEENAPEMLCRLVLLCHDTLRPEEARTNA
jgi:hypothetical protein